MRRSKLAHPTYTLAHHLQSVYIIAHREPTQQLETVLTQMQLPYKVLRQTPTPELQAYSASYRCLLNHQSAWAEIAQSNQPCLILEADFVPVQNFAQMPLPCPIETETTGIAWLYTCAPQIYTVTPERYAPGFSASTVAYMLTPAAAQALLDFSAWLSQNPTQYSAWDCELEEFLRQRHFINYVPFRNYGEHGGIPNPEHRQHGLSPIHRADALYDRLAFRPLYAKTAWEYYQERTKARFKGILRLLTGRFLRPAICRTSSYPWRLLSFAIRRQLTLNW
jgi:GR25 family glycosyltransferase involved in LPS biosynthesis